MPRVLNLVLTPLHTSAQTLSQAQYGLYQGLFAYMILGNVLLTYGMETAFFRFMNKGADAQKGGLHKPCLLGGKFVGLLTGSLAL